MGYKSLGLYEHKHTEIIWRQEFWTVIEKNKGKLRYNL